MKSIFFVLTFFLMSGICQAQSPYTFKVNTEQKKPLQVKEPTDEQKPSGFTSKSPVTLQQNALDKKKEVLQEALKQINQKLPKKISKSVTWESAYEKNGALHYTFKMNVDISAVPEDKRKSLKEKLNTEVCTKMNQSMCQKKENVLLSSDVIIFTHYTDNKNTELAVCKFMREECPKN
ncbi:unknown [Acetobacter sp. CAG:977]|nr:unknown [Acetobacter sp. CAG:977]